jgi:DNA polymerase-1
MALDAAEEIAIDTETTGLNVRNGVDYLIGICYDTGNDWGYIPIRHNTPDNISRRWIDPLCDVLSTKSIDWHNRKFDFHSWATMGVDPLKVFKGAQYDCLIMAQLVNEEWYSKELDVLAKLLLGEQKDGKDEFHTLGQLYGYANVPLSVATPYGAQDARLTRRLKQKLWPMLVGQQLESVYWDTESPFTSLLYSLEKRGVGTNRDLASSMARRGRLRMASIQRELKFNPASTIDLGRYLLDELGLPVLAKTPKGKPSFNKVAMAEYDEILQESNNPAAQRIAEFRGWQKATTSLYEPLLEKVGPDGRIRTEFKQHGTVTGRLSASNPNLQQVPRGSNKPWNGNAKACFNAGREHYLLYGWDYSQVELRLAAAYGREQVLLTEFEKESADPFRVLCELIFKQFTPELRHETKTFVYANLYGAGLAKIAAQLGRSVEETEPLYRNYHNGIPGIMAVNKAVNDVMKQQKYISYWDGRRRHIRNREDQHKAWNSMIQGGAAQLVKQAMLRCEEFADDYCYPVLTVHDEITFVIHKDAMKDYEPKIVKAMTDWPRFPVKFAVEGKEWK